MYFLRIWKQISIRLVFVVGGTVYVVDDRSLIRYRIGKCVNNFFQYLLQGNGGTEENEFHKNEYRVRLLTLQHNILSIFWYRFHLFASIQWLIFCCTEIYYFRMAAEWRFQCFRWANLLHFNSAIPNSCSVCRRLIHFQSLIMHSFALICFII